MPKASTSTSIATALQRSRRDLWLLRGVALVISVLLWVTVLGGKKIEMTKRISLDYQLPKGLVIANQVPREVTFRVAGPRAFLKELQERSVTIPIDLSKGRPGDYEVVVREDMLDVPLGLRVVSISQSSIPLKLDKVASKRVPIRAVFSGQLPSDMKVKTVTLKPSTVEIQGAVSRLQSIDVVPTEAISLSPNSLKQDLEVNLSIADLPGVSVADEDKVVQASIEIEGSLTRRLFHKILIGVKVGTGNTAKFVDAAGLGIRLRPDRVNFLLEGANKVIESLRDSDIEVWAEIPQLKGGTYKSRLVWRLAPDVRVVRRSSDWAEVVVPPL